MFLLEGYLIPADSVILFHDSADQYQSLVWSAIKYLTIYVTFMATESLSGITKFCLSPCCNCIATLAAQGSALDNCFGFVDVTFRPICKPGEHQRVVYNGHKRVHALKFQCVALPNGLIGHLYGPVGMKLLPLISSALMISFNFFFLIFRRKKTRCRHAGRFKTP